MFEWVAFSDIEGNSCHYRRSHIVALAVKQLKDGRALVRILLEGDAPRDEHVLTAEEAQHLAAALTEGDYGDWRD